MQISSFTKYTCPMDDLPLFVRSNTLQCESKHSFDITKEGYCNLLLVQNKGSKDPGDNKEMVAARRRFLSSNYYEPLAKKIFDYIEEFVQLNPRLKQIALVDAGCGEGYYLNQIADRAAKSKLENTLLLAGFDISKWAIQSAAKQNNSIAWCVASNRKLPYAKSSIPILLSLFGFPNWEKFQQVQPNGGIIILADADTNHLLELRKVLYEEVKLSSPPSADAAIAKGYREIKNERLPFSIRLSNGTAIQDLLAMTPHAYRAKESGLSKLRTIDSMEISIDIRVRVLKLEK